MEDTQEAYSHEEEVRGINISLRNAKTKFHGHREGKAKNIELLETMRSLKREVLSYRADNERSRRAQKEQNHINTQLLQSLNNLQRKIHKESSTRHATSVGHVS